MCSSDFATSDNYGCSRKQWTGSCYNHARVQCVVKFPTVSCPMCFGLNFSPCLGVFRYPKSPNVAKSLPSWVRGMLLQVLFRCVCARVFQYVFFPFVCVFKCRNVTQCLGMIFFNMFPGVISVLGTFKSTSDLVLDEASNGKQVVN